MFCSNGKPEPDVFLEAARRIGASPEETLVVEDAGPGIPAYDDSIAVVYDGDTANPDVWRASDILAAGWSGDSGWQPFALPAGTQHLQFTLSNRYSIDGSNAPLVAIDFSVASVPEPSSFALMALGLGVLVRVRSRPRA